MDIERYNASLERVRKLYELTGTGQWDKVEAELTEDFRIVEADSMPYGGVYEGKDALQLLYTKVFAFWDDPSLEIHDLTVGETEVVAMLTIHATSRHNGERLAMKMCEVFHLRGDKFCGITPYYFDTAAVAKATGVLSAV